MNENTNFPKKYLAIVIIIFYCYTNTYFIQIIKLKNLKKYYTIYNRDVKS